MLIFVVVTESEWICQNNNLQLDCTEGVLVVTWVNYGRLKPHAETVSTIIISEQRVRLDKDWIVPTRWS